MRFSIIIPTYNEERDIAATLEALLGLDYPDREILVVDDSSDRTPEIVGGYARQGVRLIHPGGGGRCEARNLTASSRISRANSSRGWRCSPSPTNSR